MAKNWVNPILKEKNLLKRTWLHIVQEMDTHLNGVPPVHIYAQRRPLESTNDYCLSHRIANFEPVTKEAFDLTISKIIDIISNANIKVVAPDFILKQQYIIDGKDIYNYCFEDLVKKSENDPNAVLVIIPKIELLNEDNIILKDIEPFLVNSVNIEYIKDNSIRFLYKIVKDVSYFIHIQDGQYQLEYTKDGKDIIEPIIKTYITKPYIYINNNTVTHYDFEKKFEYKFRLPYLYGACAWGNKFNGQDSDFDIQASRFTYLKEIRAKERCNASGTIHKDGIHCDSVTGNSCKKCGGTGYVKNDSPFSTIEVDYDAMLSGDMEKMPPIITWSEPPQQALTHSEQIRDAYYDRMLNSLGIIKQNNTNQSGESKSYDWKQMVKMTKLILLDKLKTLESFYKMIEEINELQPTSTVYLAGELSDETLEDLLFKLKMAKVNQAPPFVIEDILDKIYLKTLNPNYAELIIKIAKKYDILYIYGNDEITTAKANLGTAVGIREIAIHQTIINLLSNYYAENGIVDEKQIINYLDNNYSSYVNNTFVA